MAFLMQPLETLQETYRFEILKLNYGALAEGNQSFPFPLPVAKCSFQEAMIVLSGNEAKLKRSITFPYLTPPSPLCFQFTDKGTLHSLVICLNRHPNY